MVLTKTALPIGMLINSPNRNTIDIKLIIDIKLNKPIIFTKINQYTKLAYINEGSKGKTDRERRKQRQKRRQTDTE